MSEITETEDQRWARIQREWQAKRDAAAWTFANLDATLGSKDERRIANNTRARRVGADIIAVRLHSTDVLTLHRDGAVIADSGGWWTVTTKERINRNGTGAHVHAVRREWFVSTPTGDVPFEDGCDLAALAAEHAEPESVDNAA
jgi:hypothetical protein